MMKKNNIIGNQSIYPDEIENDVQSNTEMENDNYFQKPDTEKVASIMNKLLSAQVFENGPILSKVKKEKDDQFGNVLKEVEPTRNELKRKWNETSRTKLDFKNDFDKERKLRIIATQGVIQLFNTLEKHKSAVREQLKNAKSTSEREKIFDNNGLDSFMSLLKREENKTMIRGKTEEIKIKHGSSNSNWNVLAQNYYQEPSLNRWDQDDSDGS